MSLLISLFLKEIWQIVEQLQSRQENKYEYLENIKTEIKIGVTVMIT
jgi:hypothetical protein